jgi:hypothetical protein
MIKTVAQTTPITSPTSISINFAQHPEDQILSIVRSRGSVLLGELPKHLRRTSRWTHNLEKQGAIRRVKQRGPDKINRLQLVYCQHHLERLEKPPGITDRCWETAPPLRDVPNHEDKSFLSGGIRE